MSKDIHMSKQIRLKQESRDIVKKVLEFGVNEEQKIDIIYLISLSLEDNRIMKDLTSMLKKYRETINNDEDDNTFIKKENKILTS